MAKIIKARVRKFRGQGTTFHHPDGWDSKRINVLAYEDTGEKGQVTEHCIGIVKDEDLAEFVTNPDIWEIDIAEANKCGREWRERAVNITDPDVVIEAIQAIQVEIDATDKLTQQQKDALNPHSIELGITKSKLFNVVNYL